MRAPSAPLPGAGHLAGGVAAPRLSPIRAQRGCGGPGLLPNPADPALSSKPAACGLPSVHPPNLCPTWVGSIPARGPPWGRPLSQPLLPALGFSPPCPLPGRSGGGQELRDTPPPSGGWAALLQAVVGVGVGPLGETQGGGSSGVRPATRPSPPLGFHADAAGMSCPVSEGRPDLRAGRAPRAGPPLASISPSGSARRPRTPCFLDPPCQKDEATRWRPLLGTASPGTLLP